MKLLLVLALGTVLVVAAAVEIPDVLATSALQGQPPVRPADRGPVPVPEPTEQAIAFQRGGNALWVFGQFWGLAVPAIILLTGFSARLRTLSERLGRRWFFTIGIYVVLLMVIGFVIDLPLNYYAGYVRRHAYGLSNQTVGKWMTDAVTLLLVQCIGGILLAWIPFLLLRKSPRRWWFYTGLIAVPVLILTVLITPIWIDPLFNKFEPMRDRSLEASILQLAERAGIQGSRVFEVDKSVDTNAVNAYVTGVGHTKRVVLWDTIIAKLSREELLFVMGHEMGHYVLGHVWKIILFFSAVIMATLYGIFRTAGWAIRKYGHRFGFDRLSDVAALPLMVLLFRAFLLIVTPLTLTYLRYNEHEADRFALEITRDNYAGARAFVTLQSENLGVPRPSFLVKLWRAGHPPLGERIDFCNEYRPWVDGQPLVYERFFR
jgi:Zn-dependent protease with chaperone function